MAYVSQGKENSSPQHQQEYTKATAQIFSDNRETSNPTPSLQAMMANSPQQQKLKTTAQVMANSPAQQRLNITAQTFANKPEPLQRMEDEEPLQPKFESEPAQLEAAPEAPRPNNTGLPDNLKSGIENLSGMSMDHVKVHYNSDKPAQLQAHAYAQGSEIHVASGQEKHLPHEAWHVVQQAQGRVKPTIQAKSILINDDVGLENEADVMGAKAARFMPEATGENVLQHKSTTVVGTVIQGNFKLLDGLRIAHIIAKAKELRGEDLGADDLESLFESANADVDNPELFIEVGKIDKSFLTGQLGDSGTNSRLFVAANTLENAEAVVEAEKNNDGARNLGQVLRENANLYTLQEAGPIKLQTIRYNVFERAKHSGGADFQADATVEGMIGNIMVGGLEQGGGDSYGNIEFRFKLAKGVLLLEEENDSLNSAPIKILLQRNKGISSNPMAKVKLSVFQKIYADSNMPHPEERMGGSFLFVEESIIDTFMGTVKLAMEEGELPDWEANIELEHRNHDPLPPDPGGVNKNRTKTYDTRAGRGNRGAGQAAVMAQWSAGDYVKHFSPHVDDLKWEWLHVQGSRLGGPNSSTNLVAGTFAANTAMIPYERAVFNLSKTATSMNTVKVDWTATLANDENGQPTHVGDKITMNVSFPNGAPPVKDGHDPVKLASPFPVTFNAQEGDDVTKFERDVTELRTGKEFG